MSQAGSTSSGGGGGGVTPVTATFTPTITADGGDPAVTYSTQSGTTYALGKLVQFNITLVLTSIAGGAGNVSIGNLPLNTAVVAGQQWAFACAILDPGVSIVDLEAVVPSNSNILAMFDPSTSLVTVALLTALFNSGATTIMISGTYVSV
jgi:hypothetical protein